MSIKISDISDDVWASLREDYQDELCCMKEIDEDELNMMLYMSRKGAKA